MTRPAVHRAKRNLVLALALVLVAVLIVVWSVVRSRDGGPSLTEVRGIVGTESAALFDDPEIRDALARAGVRVYTPVEIGGSLQMPERVRADADAGRRVDFAMPSSVPAAGRLQADHHIDTVYTPFFSPMVIATWRPLALLLSSPQAGAVRGDANGRGVVDLAVLMDLIGRKVRWQSLGPSSLPSSRAVLLSTTDPTDSNSAAMFVAAASYVANSNSVVSSSDQVTGVERSICPVFTNQGLKTTSSQYLFDKYLTGGMGSVQMAFVYENQYQSALRQNLLGPDSAELYPAPTVFSQYTVVPFDDAGRRVGEVLTHDPVAIRRIRALGFRPSTPTGEPDQPGPLPASVVDPPSYDRLTDMLQRFAQDCPR